VPQEPHLTCSHFHLFNFKALHLAHSQFTCLQAPVKAAVRLGPQPFHLLQLAANLQSQPL
jgi:hypothetical protein